MLKAQPSAALHQPSPVLHCACWRCSSGSQLSMAPKVKAFSAKTLSSQRVKLDDISTAEDSGWRDLDPERVSELVDMVKDAS